MRNGTESRDKMTAYEEDQERVELDCRIIRASDKAILCDFGDKEEWIPLSQVSDDSEIWCEGDEGVIIVSRWIAKQKGLI